MKQYRRIAFVLALIMLLGVVPASVQAAVGTGWNDDCRGHRVDSGTLGTIAYGKHNWVKQSETPGNTCTSPGIASYQCSYCGANATKQTAAPGHKWSAWVTIKEATCTSQGEKTRACSH